MSKPTIIEKETMLQDLRDKAVVELKILIGPDATHHIGTLIAALAGLALIAQDELLDD